MFQTTNTTKVTLVILFIIALIFIGFYFLIRDDGTLDDSDLYLPFQKLPAENNGYHIIGNIGKPIKLKNTQEINQVLLATPFNYPRAKELVNTYQKELLQFYQELDNSYFGHTTQDEDEFLLGILHLWKLAQLQAKIALFQNHPKDAAWIGEFLVILGYKLEHCKGYLIDYYAGISIKRTGLEILQEALTKGLSKKDKKMIVKKITPYSDSCQGFIDCLRIEYSYQKDMSFNQFQLYKGMIAESENLQDKIASIIVLLPFFYKPNQTFGILANYNREIIKYISGERQEPPKPVEYPIKIYSENGFGKSLLSLVTPFLGEKLKEPKKTEDIFRSTIKKLSD